MSRVSSRAPVPPDKVDSYAERVLAYTKRRDLLYATGGSTAVQNEADNIRCRIADRVANDDGNHLTPHLIEHWHDLLAIFTQPDERDQCPT